MKRKEITYCNGLYILSRTSTKKALVSTLR